MDEEMMSRKAPVCHLHLRFYRFTDPWPTRNSVHKMTEDPARHCDGVWRASNFREASHLVQLSLVIGQQEFMFFSFCLKNANRRKHHVLLTPLQALQSNSYEQICFLSTLNVYWNEPKCQWRKKFRSHACTQSTTSQNSGMEELSR